MSSAAASSSGNSAVSGLGITFHPSPVVPARQQQHPRDFHQHVAQQQPYAQPRSLQHSISYDEGLNGRAEMGRYSQPMIKSDSSDSNGQRRVRIAVGTPEVLGKERHGMYQQQHHQLSPLSEFEHSSESDSAFDYSPASLSSLPSSTNSGAGPYAHHFPQPGQLRHAQSMQDIHYNPYAYHYAAPQMEYGHSQPFVPPPPQQYTSYHRPHPVHEEDEEPTPAPAPAPTSSRLPAFLQDRRRPSLARPKSMLELGQLQALQSVEQHSQATELTQSHHFDGSQGYQAPEEEQGVEEEESDDDRYGVGSPSESVPSSAGGLQRRNLERQLQQQHRFYQEEKERLHKSAAERHVPSYPSELRQPARMRSRSMCATDRIPRPSSREAEERDEEQVAEDTEQERPRASRPKSEVVAMRSQASMKGLEPAETGGSFVALDRDGYAEGEGISPHETSESMRNGEETVIRAEADAHSRQAESTASSATSGLARHSTLLTVGANPSRRSKELDRLLAPSGKNSALPPLPTIADSPALSASSAATTSTRPRASSHASSRPSTLAVVTSPVMLEQGKAASKARVELDVVLESSLVVEGGTLKGRMEVRVRKPKLMESEVWVGRPKVRVVGFEELSSQDARHIFYHHASTISSLEGTTKAPNSPLPCFDSAADLEGFHKARVGQHTVPFSMHLPIGKGAKGGWKGKQGVVRYIVIGSIKLKSANGKDRSIAHFYRHVEIFPYFNPAVLLAPALKPLVASAAKGLFMGGSGKVNLSAKMHRANWVAGQRCYVEISVENESSKKIKSLTLSLVRTTTIFRPRPYLDAASGYDGTSPDGDIDADACHTQTTRKKVAESTLEMGKKGNKGVTAKGNWMGVEGGESADFSHFLLVPPDALSIPRGRHVEVTYAIKVSVGGSLSADVSADIPIRVVNFLSLDPPPGHSGDISAAALPPRSLAKSWSIDQLRGAGVTRADTLRREPPTRMASMDSLRLEDLNIGRGPVTRAAVPPALSRVASADSIRTTDLSRAQSVVEPNDVGSITSKASMMAPLPPLPRDQVVVGKALERQLTHRMSLECITSAIASATARREGRSPTKSTLRSVASSAEIEQWEEQGEEDGYFGGGGERPYDGGYEPFRNMYAENHMNDLQLDDLDDVPDDQAYFGGRTQDPLTLDGPLVVEEHQGLEEDSEDELELDAVMQSRFSDDEDDEEPIVDRPVLLPPPSPRRSQAPVRSPVTRSRPSSPVKQETAMPKSAMKRSDKFAFATPTSPVKANVDLPVPQSPVRRQPSRTEMAPPRSVPRPLPPRPTGAPSFGSPTKASAARDASTRLELNKKPSVSSLKRSPGVTRKASSKSLREVASPTLSNGNTSDAPELDSSSAKSSPEVDVTRTPSQTASARPSPTISVVDTSSPRFGPSARLAPSSPRKVKAAPTTTLRAARSMHDLRTAPAPPPQRRPTTVLPSVKSKIAALETRQAALHRLSGVNTGSSSDLARANSVTSEYSDASFNLTDLGRANSMASFKAPLLRRKVQPVPEMPQL